MQIVFVYQIHVSWSMLLISFWWMTIRDKWKNRNSDLLFSAHMEFGICEHQQVVSVLQVCKFILENSDSWRNWKSPDFSGQLFIRSGNSTGNLWEITSAPVSVLSPSTYPTKENLIGLYIGCETSSYWW